MLALFLVGFDRLLIDQLVELAVTVFRVIAIGIADIILIEILVGVVETAADQALRR